MDNCKAKLNKYQKKNQEYCNILEPPVVCNKIYKSTECIHTDEIGFFLLYKIDDAVVALCEQR